MWRAHSCAPRSQSCERVFRQNKTRPQEWGRGTHECVRHINETTNSSSWGFSRPHGALQLNAIATACFRLRTFLPLPDFRVLLVGLLSWTMPEYERFHGAGGGGTKGFVCTTF